LIADEKDGYLVKDRDIDAFVGRICGLIENPKLRKAMGQTALVSSQRYSAEQIMPYWLQLFSMLSPSVVVNKNRCHYDE
jgi:glycosyltransferase involved in cell wall biosynthesis